MRFSISRFLDETHCVRITNYLWTTDPLCFLQSQSDQSQCYPFFWSEVQGSASYFFFAGDNDDWDKYLRSKSVHLQGRYLFLCSELQVSSGEHSAYKLSSSSVLGATPCARVLQRSPVFFQNRWYKGLEEGSRASCTEQRSNTLRSSTDVCLPSEVWKTSEKRFHNIHMPVLVLLCVKN